MIEAVEEACRIAALPNRDELDTSLNYQLGTLKYLARHLPEDNHEIKKAEPETF